MRIRIPHCEQTIRGALPGLEVPAGAEQRGVREALLVDVQRAPVERRMHDRAQVAEHIGEAVAVIPGLVRLHVLHVHTQEAPEGIIDPGRGGVMLEALVLLEDPNELFSLENHRTS